MNSSELILLAGASGYIGGRLAHFLAERGRTLRCMVRRPEEALERLPLEAEVVKGDVLRPESLSAGLKGVHTAYYLVHSMGDAEYFEELERRGAENFSRACQQSGVKKIIYLGGLGNSQDSLSAHLRSRHEVGRVLRASGIEVIEFRASIIIGSGSLSFEMVRSLTEKLPIMITPKWVHVKAQPLGIEDLLHYLAAALDSKPGKSRIVEIGGKDVVSYGGLIKEYAKQRGIKRVFVLVPLLTPKLSSLWLGLVTPLYARVGHKLITSIKNPTVVLDPEPAKEFPVEPMDVSTAMSRALSKEDQEFGRTHWSDAISSLGRPRNWAGITFGNRIVDSRELVLDYPASSVFSRVQSIGGKTGWYYANFLWVIRGFIDRLVGGPGLRRGRRHPLDVRVGDVIDFWRVEAFESGKKLRLRAEMKVPGRAWLEFSVEKKNDKVSLRQTAMFDPVGLSGRLYWYALYPLHFFVFRGMLRNIAAKSKTPYSPPAKVVGRT